MAKYRNTKTVLNGITFDSKREAARWSELLLLQRAGKIADLRRQVAYVLAPSVKFSDTKRAKPALKFNADFAYIEDGKPVVEDSKGVITTAFTIKRHLMLAVHGIDVRLTK